MRIFLIVGFALILGFALTSGLAGAETWQPQPIKTLAKKVPVSMGKASMHVTRPSDPDGQIRVYLINASGQALAVPTFHEQVEYGVDAWTEQNRWERTETVEFGLCGVGFGEHTLPDQTYVVCRGSLAWTRPSSAQSLGGTTTEYPTRLVVHCRGGTVASNAIVSNVVRGHHHPESIELTRNDDIAIASAPLSRLIEIVHGRDEGINKYMPAVMGPFRDPRELAIDAMVSGDHPRSKVRSVLDLIAGGSIPEVQAYAKEALSRLKPTKDQRLRLR